MLKSYELFVCLTPAITRFQHLSPLLLLVCLNFKIHFKTQISFEYKLDLVCINALSKLTLEEGLSLFTTRIKTNKIHVICLVIFNDKCILFHNPHSRCKSAVSKQTQIFSRIRKFLHNNYRYRELP